MSFNIVARINNLASAINTILNDLAQLQSLSSSNLTKAEAITIYQRISNMISTYNSSTSSSRYYNAVYINTPVSDYQKSFTASLPLTLNSTTNILSIDLTSYYTKTASDSRYQQSLSATLPLTLSSNTIAIDSTKDLGIRSLTLSGVILLDNAGTSNPSKIKYQQDLLTVENNGSFGLIGPITCSSANSNNFSGAIFCPSITRTGNTTCDLLTAKRLAIDPNEYHSPNSIQMDTLFNTII